MSSGSHPTAGADSIGMMTPRLVSIKTIVAETAAAVGVDEVSSISAVEAAVVASPSLLSKPNLRVPLPL